MKATNSTTATWAFLVVLTISSAAFSTSSGKYAVMVILFLAILKFVSIAFQFMELKKAHAFWKGSIIAFLILFMTTILIII